MFQVKVIEKIKTHALFSVTFFFFESRTVYEIMRKNIVEVGHRGQYGACPLHAGYLSLQTHTLRLCNIYCFSMITMVARCTNAPQVLRYTYIACLVKIVSDLGSLKSLGVFILQTSRHNV